MNRITIGLHAICWERNDGQTFVIAFDDSFESRCAAIQTVQRWFLDDEMDFGVTDLELMHNQICETVEAE